MQIYVGNLAFTATEAEVRQAFEAYGTVERVNLITDRETGRARGFGFVEMPDAAEARAAMAGLNGTRVLKLGGSAGIKELFRPHEGWQTAAVSGHRE
jgi:RNA recognition motif-containing protein